MAHLYHLSLDSPCSALALPLRGHNQVHRFQPAPSSDPASLAAVPTQAPLQLIGLSTVKAAIPSSDNVDTAAAHC